MIHLLPDKKFTSFIQSSDWHIGDCRNFPGYLERHKDILWQILNYADTDKIPLLIPGDVFHRLDTRDEERLLFMEFLLEVERRGIPTVISPGNHDHKEADITQLDLFAKIPLNNIVVTTWNPEVVKIGNLGVIVLSWQKYSTEQIEQEVTKRLQFIADCEFKIVMLHELIAGSKFDNGQVKSSKIKIPFISDIDYWAVGDIHKSQMANQANAWYAGAPAQFKFDDVLRKGCLKVDLTKPEEPEFLPIKSKKLLVVSSVDEMTEDAYYLVKGDVEDVLRANEDARVMRSEWVRTETDEIEYDKVGITDGLIPFLAEKGVEEDLQTKAVEWVDSKVGGA